MQICQLIREGKIKVIKWTKQKLKIFIPLQDCQQGLPAFQVSPHIWPPDYQALFLPGRDLIFFA